MSEWQDAELRERSGDSVTKVRVQIRESQGELHRLSGTIKTRPGERVQILGGEYKLATATHGELTITIASESLDGGSAEFVLSAPPKLNP